MGSNLRRIKPTLVSQPSTQEKCEEVHAVVAVRLSADSLQPELLKDALDEYKWSDISHVVLDCLMVRDCRIQLGTSGPDPSHDPILSSTVTYLPLLQEYVLKKWPHIRLVLTTPKQMLKLHARETVSGLQALAISFPEVLFEIPMKEFDELYNYFKLTSLQFWVVQNEPSMYGRYMGCSSVDKHVIKSFGYLKHDILNTTHGRMYELCVYPESALCKSQEVLDLIETSNWFTSTDQLVLELDTQGVEYLRKVSDSKYANRVRVLPYKEIIQLMTAHREDVFSYELFFDAYNGASGFEFKDVQGDHYVSFDSADVTKAKLKFVHENGMAGVMMGDPCHDTRGSQSVWQRVTGYLA